MSKQNAYMKRKAPADPHHLIWRKVRGPFRVLACTAHDWEVYDVQKAGCKRCGRAHVCSNSMVGNDCPLVHLDDGGVCCPITGFCASVVRYSDCEYVENVTFCRAKADKSVQQQIQVEEVLHLVKWFLKGQQSFRCKKEEVDKTLSRVQSTFVKSLKGHKLKTAQSPARALPCVCSALAQTMHQLKLKRIQTPSDDLCRFCATHIAQCLNSLNLSNTQSRRVHLVVGMLYLMKQGLVIQNVQWLPKVPTLAHCLPHETSLEKVFKLSMKLVCETENEIKLALRQRVKLL